MGRHGQRLAEAPLFLVANEFFDALPIRQFVRHPAGWQERVVGLSDGALSFGLTPPAPLAALDHRLSDTEPGDMVELCPAASAVAEALGARIARHGGVALILDYGGWHARGDTLQALHRHAFADPLAAPGEADLTAHVDFEPIARAAAPAGASRLTPQGVFLERLGITARAQRLAAALEGSARDAHIAAHRRLTHPEEMGNGVQGAGPSCPRPSAARSRLMLEIITSDLLSPIRHGFFTRKGGASSGIFAGLNCGPGSSDLSEVVAINRARVADAMGVAADHC